MARWTLIVTMLLIALVVVAFTLQNASHVSPLQLNLGVVAWRLREPASVPLLMGSSFAVGFVVAASWGAWRSASLSREVRRLQQEVALAGSRSKDGWAG
ncbi:MAG: LapA family protein [Myxococcota bacterium]